jgi:hypothetical protein
LQWLLLPDQEASNWKNGFVKTRLPLAAPSQNKTLTLRQNKVVINRWNSAQVPEDVSIPSSLGLGFPR